MRWRRCVFGLFCLALFVGACVPASSGMKGSQEESHASAPITIDELPAGLGRGTPVASLNDVRNGATVARGKEAPDFRMILADGRSMSLHDLKGRPVLVNFWASWCGPCRLEMPDLVAAYEAHDSDLVVLAVNAQEKMAAIAPFMQQFQMTMPIVVDEAGLIMRRYQVRNMPTSFFIDRNGLVSDIWPGMMTADVIDQLAQKIR